MTKITYKIASQNELEDLVNFLSDPSIDLAFVKPLSQRSQSIRDRVYDKFKKGYWILAKDISRRDTLVINKDGEPEIEKAVKLS